MTNIALLRLQMNHLVTQAREDIRALSHVNGSPDQARQLQRLWDTVSYMHGISELLAYEAGKVPHFPPASAGVYTPGPAGLPAGQNGVTAGPYIPPVTPLPDQTLPPPRQRVFTEAELADYDGKNGRPAYAAVNGIVYDVTNNRAWAAATHFGLTAGKDYSAEFQSCHMGQQSILDTLPVVGRLEG